jgi:hypothetical protein
MSASISTQIAAPMLETNLDEPAAIKPIINMAIPKKSSQRIQWVKDKKEYPKNGSNAH